MRHAVADAERERAAGSALPVTVDDDRDAEAPPSRAG